MGDGAVLCEPRLQERRGPRADRVIVDRALGKVRGALLGAGQLHAGVTARGPAAHHRVGDLGVELDAIGGRAVAQRLHPEDIALGEQLCAVRQLETLAVPLIDDLGPVAADIVGVLGHADRIIADLRLAFRMRGDARTEMLGQHLGAQADPEEGLSLGERNGDPIDLAAHELVAVVGALRPAEDDGAGVAGERLGQRIAQPRPADIERHAALGEVVADPAGGGELLMQHQKHRPLGSRRRTPGIQFRIERCVHDQRISYSPAMGLQSPCQSGLL